MDKKISNILPILSKILNSDDIEYSDFSEYLLTYKEAMSDMGIDMDETLPSSKIESYEALYAFLFGDFTRVDTWESVARLLRRRFDDRRYAMEMGDGMSYMQNSIDVMLEMIIYMDATSSHVISYGTIFEMLFLISNEAHFFPILCHHTYPNSYPFFLLSISKDMGEFEKTAYLRKARHYRDIQSDRRELNRYADRYEFYLELPEPTKNPLATYILNENLEHTYYSMIKTYPMIKKMKRQSYFDNDYFHIANEWRDRATQFRSSEYRKNQNENTESFCDKIGILFYEYVPFELFKANVISAMRQSILRFSH